MIKKILRINRRVAHYSYEIVFPLGVIVIAICGLIITEAEGKVANWSLDFSSMPMLVGYIMLWGALTAITSVFTETARKAISVVYKRLGRSKSPSLQQRIDEVSR